MTEVNAGERWLNIAGSIASLAALGYLLTHLPRRGERSTPVAGLPPRLELRERFPSLYFRSGFTANREPRVWVMDALSGEEVGYVFAFSCAKGEYASIRDSEIDPKWQQKGLYPVMLTALRDVAQRNGCRGIVSRGSGRIADRSTRSWERFARAEPRVRRDGADFYLDGLPTRGRIPLATAKRALNRLGRKAKACGITPALLREGMEIEREHRDVTGGRVGTTAKIAAAHICEDKQYYRKLKRYIEK